MIYIASLHDFCLLSLCYWSILCSKTEEILFGFTANLSFLKYLY